MIKVKTLKIKTPSIKNATMHVTRIGDRGLTSAQKLKVKQEQGFRCAKCGKKKNAQELQVHHKKEIHKHKDKLTGVDLPHYSFGKKIKLLYDRRSNLEALCIICHNKTKRTKKTKSLIDIKMPEWRTPDFAKL